MQGFKEQPPFLLQKADLREGPHMSKRGLWWMGALARLPLAHSSFWVVFFIALAVLGNPRSSRNASASSEVPAWMWAYDRAFDLATVWIVYGFTKFALTLVSCFKGVSKIRETLAVDDWRERSLRCFHEAQVRHQLGDKVAAAEAGAPGGEGADPRGESPPKHDADAGAGKGRGTMSANCIEASAQAALVGVSGGLGGGGAGVPVGRFDYAALARDDFVSEGFGLEGAAATPMHFDDVLHVIVVPNYKEPAEVLARTLDTLRDQTVASAQLVVVLAMEGRDPKAHETAAVLIQEYGSSFVHMFYTVHKMQAGEVGGKSSNENWAMRCAKHKLVDELGVDSSRVVLTTCDADTYFAPSHFACLSHHFACDPLRATKFWQAATCFYPNLVEVPVLCRVRYAIISVGFVGLLANPLAYTFPFSCYSLSLDLALEADFWDPAVIPEDWHMYLRCFYATRGRATVEPLFLPVGCECVVASEDTAENIEACYSQSKRWQWGAVDFGFICVSNTQVGAAPDGSPLKAVAERVGGGRPFWLRKALILFTAYEHHLLFNVMWCLVLLAPFIFHNDWSAWRSISWAVFLVVNWTVLVTLDGLYRGLVRGRRHFKLEADERSAFGGVAAPPSGIASSGLLARSLPDKISSGALSSGGRGEGARLLEAPQQAGAAGTGSLAGDLALAWQPVVSSWAGVGRALGFWLFPLSDFLLFVVPTFHAHLRMAMRLNEKRVQGQKVRAQVSFSTCSAGRCMG